MFLKRWSAAVCLCVFGAGLCLVARPEGSPAEQHLLYVASPGVRNYTPYGGVGVLVFDMDHGFRFVRRIATWEVAKGREPENVKGIAADARSGRIYVTSLTRTLALDAVTGRRIWDRAYPGGCDRLAITPDGKLLYVPQFEGRLWHVVDAETGAVLGEIESGSGSHNTICSLDGSEVYLAALSSPDLLVVNAKTRKVVRSVGPFTAPIRPFTMNGSGTLCFVNVNGLLGFEVGDLRTGGELYRVEVQGYAPGPVKRHGCPSHGIALSPDEKEVWVADGANDAIHIFEATVMPPRQTATVKVRDLPGWISFSMDGRYAFSSTGEIIDAASKKVVATLRDEAGREVQSEKMLDITIAKGKVAAAGNQFGVGKVEKDARRQKTKATPRRRRKVR